MDALRRMLAQHSRAKRRLAEAERLLNEADEVEARADRIGGEDARIYRQWAADKRAKAARMPTDGLLA